jgi:hypothetical protein
LLLLQPIAPKPSAELARRRNLAPIAATLNKALNGALPWESAMNRRTAVQVPELSGIDLEFRPRDYFWAADLKIPLLSGIGGETRRQLVGEMVTGGIPIPAGLDAPVLDEEARQARGRIHPSNMGGEFLPALRRDEVEIARISLASVTGDQIRVRARRSGKRIVYRVVDEYGSEIATYICRPATSVSPLSLRRLIELMESACEGGSIILPILKMNSGAAALEEFISVTSDFYPDLGRYYRALTDKWIADLRESYETTVDERMALLFMEVPAVTAMRFVATRPETREAMKMLELDPSRDEAMVSSMTQDVAFVAIAWRDGWVTEFEIQRNGWGDAEMAVYLENFGNPITAH